jgi:hypothetical protein
MRFDELTLDDGLSQSTVIRILQDSRGLNLFDPKTQSFHHFRNDPEDPKTPADDTVYSLNVDVDGTVCRTVPASQCPYVSHRRKIRREEEYSNRLETQVQDRTAQLAESNQELKQLNQSL